MEQEENTAKRGIIKKTGIIFIAVLLFLTFFSNTLYSLNAAGVIADFARKGTFTRSETAYGTVDFVSVATVYTDYSGVITLHAGKGDSVKAGGRLFSVTVNMDTLYERLQFELRRLGEIVSSGDALSAGLQERLAGETNKLRRVQLIIEKNEADILYLRNKMDGLRSGAAVQKPDFSRIDYESERLAAEIKRAEEALASAQSLYEAGIASESELNNHRWQLDSLRAALRLSEMEKERMLEEYETALDGTYNDQAETYRRDIENLLFQIELNKFDENEIVKSIDALNGMIRASGGVTGPSEASVNDSISELNALLAADGVMTVMSEYNCIVTDILGGIEIDAHVSANQPVMRLCQTQDVRNPFKTELLFPDNVNYLKAGGQMRLKVILDEPINPLGRIEKIQLANNWQRVIVHFGGVEGLPLSGGERVEAVAEHTAETGSSELLPNTAVHKDPDGDFVLYIERERVTFLGDVYYARRQSVSVFESNETESSVWFFVPLSNPIIINSDRPVRNGDRVKIVGLGDVIASR